MLSTRVRLLLLVLSLPVLTLLCGLGYMVGMDRLEGEPRTFLESVQWAAESLTTTGYGEDGRWQHPVMAVFAISVQFGGVFLVFLIIPIYLIPFLEERFETRLPREVKKVHDHIVVYGYNSGVSTLLEQLRRAGKETVVVEERDAEARRAFEAGYQVVHRRLQDGALAAAALDRARTLIANSSDESNAAIILTARHRGFEGDILALVEEPIHRRPITLAGATATFTPRHMLGAALAARASRRISPRVSGVNQLDEHLSIREVRVRLESPLAGKTLRQSRIGAETGATVIAQWVGGELVAQPTPEMVISGHGVLVVVGSDESLERLGDLATGTLALRHEGPFVVCGYGEVGQKVAQLLRDVGEEVRVIDRQAKAGVDLVGDVLEIQVLKEAGAETAQGIVIALDSDSATLFAVVILEDLAPDTPLIVRVNQAENVERTHRAGADYALSISQVTAQVLAGRMLGDEAVSILPSLKVKKVHPQGLVGKSVGEVEIRQRTGCSIVALGRGGTVITTLEKGLRFEADDILYVCGNSTDVDRFPEHLG
jgi:Trk K+ transport system NAD-binding subunit